MQHHCRCLATASNNGNFNFLYGDAIFKPHLRHLRAISLRSSHFCVVVLHSYAAIDQQGGHSNTITLGYNHATHHGGCIYSSSSLSLRFSCKICIPTLLPSSLALFQAVLREHHRWSFSRSAMPRKFLIFFNNSKSPRGAATTRKAGPCGSHRP
jgi:predicted outer membrane repeat protein